MVILGIDASTSSTGWGILDSETKEKLSSGCIKPKGSDWRDRIQQEWTLLCQIVEKYKPERIYAEDVPMKDGKPTIMKLGSVQGMIICLAAQYGIEVQFLLPADWRSPLGLFDGTRNGTHREVLKKKAIEMVNKQFNTELQWIKEGSKLNEDDEAEAILIAYSQINPRRFGRPKSQ